MLLLALGRAYEEGESWKTEAGATCRSVLSASSLAWRRRNRIQTDILSSCIHDLLSLASLRRYDNGRRSSWRRFALPPKTPSASNRALWSPIWSYGFASVVDLALKRVGHAFRSSAVTHNGPLLYITMRTWADTNKSCFQHAGNEHDKGTTHRSGRSK